MEVSKTKKGENMIAMTNGYLFVYEIIPIGLIKVQYFGEFIFEEFLFQNTFEDSLS